MVNEGEQKGKIENTADFQKATGLPVKTLMARGHLSDQAFMAAMNEQGIQIPAGYHFDHLSRWWLRMGAGAKLLESYAGQEGAFKATIAVFKWEG